MAGILDAEIKRWASSQSGKQMIMNSVKDKAYERARVAALDFLTILRDCAASCDLPPSVLADVMSLAYDEPVWDGDKYSIELKFTSDLHRDSLVPEKYRGADNIIVIFNNGAHAPGSVHGLWHGEEVWSQRNRTGQHFLETAVASFNARYGGRYKIYAELSATYS